MLCKANGRRRAQQSERRKFAPVTSEGKLWSRKKRTKVMRLAKARE